MAIIRVTKEFRFEMAHALWKYDGLCKNMHGHSYILYVTVMGEPITDKDNPKCGMVIDFGDLKRIVNSTIVDKLDHAVMFNVDATYKTLVEDNKLFDRHEIVDYQPTCENMVVDFAERITKLLPKDVKLYSIKLHETATSFAEWYASDNL